MKIITKLIMAGVAACGIAMATPAQAAWHHHGHYYAHRHFWHGHWYAPGYYGPTVFVGSPFYWSGWGPGYYGSGPGVSFAFGGGGYWYHGHHYYHGHYGYRHGYRHHH